MAGLVLASSVVGGVAGGGPDAAAAPPRVVTISIPRNGMLHGFGARNYTLARGGALRVVNHDTVRHTVTSVGRNRAGNPLFNTSVAPGKAALVRGVAALAAGRYGFYCAVHPSMRAILTLQGSGGGTTGSTFHFEQSITFPPVITAASSRIVMKGGYQQMLPHGPRTAVRGYNGTYPGPTIVRASGYATSVQFADGMSAPYGRFSVHLHGDHHEAASDGQPTTHLIGSGRSMTYHYPLRDGGRPVPPSFGFYHDHVMGATGRNNWLGMQGMFIVNDGRAASFGLPTGYYDRPLLISDRSFTSTNQLAGTPATSMGMPMTGSSAPPGDATVGSKVLVNGRYAPYFYVRTHQYRLRLLNGSNFQSYDLRLSNGRSFYQVGTGSSLLPHPVKRNDILLGPAQRADVVVNFAGELHRNVVLSSVPRRDGSKSGIGTPSVPIMQFRVSGNVADHGRIHPNLEATPTLTGIPASSTATWDFNVGHNAQGSYWTINGRPYSATRIDRSVALGSVQRWTLHNSSTITHYVHLHEEQWHTLSRNGKAPPAYEGGLQDTWRLDPGDTVVVAARMTDYTGVFMIHCHMLDHEDHGMMAQFQVVAPGANAATAVAGYRLAAGAARAPTGDADMSGDMAGDMVGDMAGMAHGSSHPGRHAGAGSDAAPDDPSVLTSAAVAAGAVAVLYLVACSLGRRRRRFS